VAIKGRNSRRIDCTNHREAAVPGVATFNRRSNKLKKFYQICAKSRLFLCIIPLKHLLRKESSSWRFLQKVFARLEHLWHELICLQLIIAAILVKAPAKRMDKSALFTVFIIPPW